MQELVNDPNMLVDDTSEEGSTAPGDVSWPAYGWEKSGNALRGNYDNPTATINLQGLLEDGLAYRIRYTVTEAPLRHLVLRFTEVNRYNGSDLECQIGEHTIDAVYIAGLPKLKEQIDFGVDDNGAPWSIITRFSVMALAREEQIMEAIETAVTGLATTGGNVFRGRAYPLEKDDTPGLVVYAGPDSVSGEIMNDLLDWDLGVAVECYVETAVENVDTLLAQIRKEVHAAIMANPQLGLSNFVIDTVPIIAAETEIEGKGKKPTARRRLEFMVRYRSSRTDISE